MTEQMENANWLEKFFGYFKYEDGLFAHYKDDGVSDPYTDYRQLLWIVIMPFLVWAVYKYFINRQVQAKRWVIGLSIALIISRVYENSAEVIFGREDILWLFPYHMCGISSFAVPIVALFNIKKLKLPIYTIGIMGGIITVLIGETFTSSFTTFYALQSVFMHTLLIIIPVIEHARGEFRFDIKQSWTIFPIMLLFISWAAIGNRIFFAGDNTNFMYLDESGLPGGFGGSYYFGVYIIIFIIMYSLFFVPPWFRQRKKLNI